MQNVQEFYMFLHFSTAKIPCAERPHKDLHAKVAKTVTQRPQRLLGVFAFFA